MSTTSQGNMFGSTTTPSFNFNQQAPTSTAPFQFGSTENTTSNPAPSFPSSNNFGAPTGGSNPCNLFWNTHHFCSKILFEFQNKIFYLETLETQVLQELIHFSLKTVLPAIGKFLGKLKKSLEFLTEFFHMLFYRGKRRARRWAFFTG